MLTQNMLLFVSLVFWRHSSQALEGKSCLQFAANCVFKPQKRKKGELSECLLMKLRETGHFSRSLYFKM